MTAVAVCSVCKNHYYSARAGTIEVIFDRLVTGWWLWRICERHVMWFWRMTCRYFMLSY